VPRLKCTFREFIWIIEANGFRLHRQGATSHRQYRGVVARQVHYVDVAPHQLGTEIATGTLKSMIRQSGLSQSLFRK
jgi:predicted RNA binding protein YcfA (HicA-like mRNA interferase family)